MALEKHYTSAPPFTVSHLNLTEAFAQAFAFHQAGRLADAKLLYRQIIAQQPDHADAIHLLGVIAHQVGRHSDAVLLMQRAIALAASVPDYHNNLSLALERLGRLEEAATACRSALGLNPAFPEGHNSLGNILARLGRTDDAIAAYSAALQLTPTYAEAHCNLGAALKDRGDLDAALAAFRTALNLRPYFPKAHSHLIFTLHYHQDTNSAILARELRAWRDKFAAPHRASIAPHRNVRDARRRVRIGYVSPDFRQHAVGRFLLPLLREHDHTRFEIYCYSDVSVPDEMTNLLRSLADHWLDTIALSDESLGGRIREDQVDILVDLSLHTGRNRLPVFARKPAPVQVTYLAYCGSSGLDTIDYRLTDPFFDPAGSNQSAYSERSIVLPETYWCFQPIDRCPEVNALPALQNQHITFGCLNNFCKISHRTLATWLRLLVELPNARLVLHATQGQHRHRTLSQLADGGVAPSRVSFIEHLPLHAYTAAYQTIDLALDPFPYGGGTTTCDALWMGVPVITLTGEIAITRAGASVLHNLGLPELIATSDDDYVKLATGLARDLQRLAELRATLRTRMQNSALMNAPRFTRHVESAYRQMWQRWCEKPTESSI